MPGIKKIAVKSMIVNMHGQSIWTVTTLSDIFGAGAGANNTNCVVVAANMDETANRAKITGVSVRNDGQVLIHATDFNDVDMRIGFVGIMIG